MGRETIGDASADHLPHNCAVRCCTCILSTHSTLSHLRPVFLALYRFFQERHGFGRGLASAGVGSAANFCIEYWAETTPHPRGMVVMMYQGFINLVQFVAPCINQARHDMTTTWSWKTPLMTIMIPPLVLLACLPFIPDTPSKHFLGSNTCSGWFVQ